MKFYRHTTYSLLEDHGCFHISAVLYPLIVSKVPPGDSGWGDSRLELNVKDSFVLVAPEVGIGYWSPQMFGTGAGPQVSWATNGVLSWVSTPDQSGETALNRASTGSGSPSLLSPGNDDAQWDQPSVAGILPESQISATLLKLSAVGLGLSVPRKFTQLLARGTCLSSLSNGGGTLNKLLGFSLEGLDQTLGRLRPASPDAPETPNALKFKGRSILGDALGSSLLAKELKGVLSNRDVLGMGEKWDAEGRWMVGLREPGARAESADVDHGVFLTDDKLKGW